MNEVLALAVVALLVGHALYRGLVAKPEVYVRARRKKL